MGCQLSESYSDLVPSGFMGRHLAGMERTISALHADLGKTSSTRRQHSWQLAARTSTAWNRSYFKWCQELPDKFQAINVRVSQHVKFTWGFQGTKEWWSKPSWGHFTKEEKGHGPGPQRTNEHSPFIWAGFLGKPLSFYWRIREGQKPNPTKSWALQAGGRLGEDPNPH